MADLVEAYVPHKVYALRPYPNLQQLALREAGLSLVQTVRYEMDVEAMIVNLIYKPTDNEVVVLCYDAPENVLLDVTFMLAEYEQRPGHETEPRQDASKPVPLNTEQDH